VSCTQQAPTPQSVSTKQSDQSVSPQVSRQSSQKQEATASKSWGWVKAGNNASNYWDVETGPADVIINDKKFSARLYWKENPTEVKTSLEGTIQEGKITAKEVIQASDYTGSVYTGTYMKTDYVQTINLSDGLGMIGITQPIKQ
jgi:outer membrane biogenesis lipoprotein LolB